MTSVAVGLLTTGLVIGVGALLALHLLPTGLSPVRNPVSQYGISRYRAGYRAQTLGYALAGVGAAVGIVALPGAGRLPAILCAVFAASRAAISWFPMDAPGAAATATGERHGLLAIAAFVSAALAAAALSHTLDRQHIEASVADLSVAAAGVMVGALIGMRFDRRSGGHRFGLVERCFYLAMTAWFIALDVLLATR